MHVVVLETNEWVFGKTYDEGGVFFGNWCRFKGSGKPPTPEELQESEIRRMEAAKALVLERWKKKQADHGVRR